MSTSARPEPIAVTGLACRLPGAQDPAAFWDLLCEGRDALTEAPPERYAGPVAAPRGGFLPDVAGFDADFFGISPREAAATDPQQRLMLELAWEALEDAFVVPEGLRGTDAGVFVGATADDYAQLTHARGAAAITPHTLPGLLRGVIANRISHVLGLGGPSLTVDTGQSSGLAAVHVACTSLWRGESDLALAGAVHLNLAPGGLLTALRSGALSPDGRCRTFDARANGYARGEGGVLVVLKPLARALDDGDRVHCVVLGSAMTADGGPDPLTVPGRRAQEEVLRRACATAGVTPSQVRYVELHGTGTRVGDPVEAAALGAVHGTGRAPGDALRVGSAKTNVGHLEGAAGMVGLLKTALSLRHRQLPPTLNFTAPNPAIPLTDLGLTVQTALTDWPHPDEPLLAGVSSFGMGGANCHVVLGAGPGTAATGTGPARVVSAGAAATEAPASSSRLRTTPGPVPGRLAAETPSPDEATPEKPASGRSLAEEVEGPRPHPRGAGPAAGVPGPARVPVPWLVSGRTASALRAQARVLADRLRRRPSTDPSAAARTLATARTHHEYRAALLDADGRWPADALDALAEGRPDPSVIQGRARAGAGLAVLFTGQGARWPGAGRTLYAAFPAFARALDEIAEHLDPHLDRPLHDLLLRPADSDDLTLRTDYAQPALFALETALLRLLRSWGVRPTALAGHSVGELAAAHAAGVFSLRDAARLVAARGRLMHQAPGEGAMLTVQAGEEEVRAALPSGAVDVAAVNAPGSVVVSGTAEAVEEVGAHWAARGRRTRRLRVGHGFHSPLMDPVLEEFRRVASDIAYGPPRIPVVSNVTGTLATPGQLCSPEYWTRHIRATVRFADAVRTLDTHGTGAYLELGPEPTLTPQAARCLPPTAPDGHPPPTLTATLRPGHDEPTTLLTAVAKLHLAGQAVDWSALVGPGPRADLPAYAFQRRRHWLPETPAGNGGTRTAAPMPDPATSTPDRTAMPDDDASVPAGATGAPDAMAPTPRQSAGTAEPEAVPPQSSPPPAAPPPGPPTQPDETPDQPYWRRLLAPRTGPDRYRLALDLVRAEAAAVLEHSGPEAVDPHRSFRDAGFDSVTGVEFRDRLRELTGLPLPATLVFDRPTPAALTEHLLTELTPRPEPASAALTVLARLRTALSELPVDPTTDERIADGLGELLSALTGTAHATHRPLTGTPGRPLATPGDVTDLTEKIGTATDDEIFTLLDHGFDA